MMNSNVVCGGGGLSGDGCCWLLVGFPYTRERLDF